MSAVQVQPGRLRCVLHPAGGPVELRLEESGELQLAAEVVQVGPGYHRFLDEVCAGLARDLGLRWRPAPVEDPEAACLAWLQARAVEALTAWLSGPRPADVHWLRPLFPGLGEFQGRGAVATLLGPRSEAWLQAVVADPRAGLDAFPWWGADGRPGRAGVLIWREVRWRLPTSAEELATLAEVANLLAELEAEAPERLDLPFAAWAELLELLHESDARRSRVRARAGPGPRPGYRRLLVREALPGGWSLALPGAMGVSWTEEGWCAWDEGRTAWFTALHGAADPPLPEEGEPLWEGKRPDGRARLLQVEEDGEPTFVLSGYARDGERVGLLSLAWTEPSLGQAWAEAAWRSLRSEDAG